ncbi:hypothetical protein R1sor_022896 [Riccia sorocarpa]|uniref:Pyruvate kinase C-terminal domain-containing protein n=1 Tax=Riccia sorocarpa TaxID=122646 RepID=A0ABD3GPC3_9MARC
MRNIMRTLAYRSFLLHFLSVFQSKSATQLSKWLSAAFPERISEQVCNSAAQIGSFTAFLSYICKWQVSLRTEKWCRDEKHHENTRLQKLSAAFPERISEQVCNSATQMANKLEVETIFVYTRRGYMAQLLSRCHPDCPIFSFTEEPKNVRRRLNLSCGLISFRVDFSEDMEKNLRRTFALLKARGMMKSGNLVVAVSDITSNNLNENLQSIQVRRIP